jgi:hypothetical protein
MDNAEPDDLLLDEYPVDERDLIPLPFVLRPVVRELARAYRDHTGVEVTRLELQIVDAEGTVKDLNFPSPGP